MKVEIFSDKIDEFSRIEKKINEFFKSNYGEVTNITQSSSNGMLTISIFYIPSISK